MPWPFSLCIEYVVRSFLPDGVFLPCDHGLDFLHISLLCVCVCVLCVFFPFILDIKFVRRTSRGHTGRRSHRISPPSFCRACLNFSREKDSAVPSPRRPSSRILCTNE